MKAATNVDNYTTFYHRHATPASLHMTIAGTSKT